MTALPQRMMVDYINDEINNILAEKETLTKAKTSLNRLIASKMLEKDKNKNSISRGGEYKNVRV